MVEVEIIAPAALERPGDEDITRLCRSACARLGVEEGHVAVEFVDATRIAELNETHRGKTGPTDVLSFPIDGRDALPGVPRELGDVVICPEHTVDVREAVVHGTLHLLGLDHDQDDGEMFALQDELMAEGR